MTRDPDASRDAARVLAVESGVAILHEDNHVLGVAKPAGLASQGGSGGNDHLVACLERYRRHAEGKPGRAFIGLVHRLDRNVSGAMVVAKTSKAAARLAALFRERSPALEKTYVAWVEGVPEPLAGRLVHMLVRSDGKTREAHADERTSAREARLAYEVEATARDRARVRVRLETGLGHQIRCQLALVGHPIVGDGKYGGTPGARPALHAARLVFPHPVPAPGGEPTVVLEAPLPEDLARLDKSFKPLERGHRHP